MRHIPPPLHVVPVNCSGNDDFSFVGESSLGNTVVDELRERVGYLKGKLETQESFLLEQIEQLRASLEAAQQENCKLKTKMDEDTISHKTSKALLEEKLAVEQQANKTLKEKVASL